MIAYLLGAPRPLVPSATAVILGPQMSDVKVDFL